MTEPMRILDYLKIHKVATTNELRQMSINQGSMIVDVPKAVSILVLGAYKNGIKHPITSKRNRDGSATYTYNGASTPIETPKTPIVVKDQDGNEYIKYVPVNEVTQNIVQGSLL
jgi:hypothetical protein